MCRICGRMVRCIFDSMPSRTLSRPVTSSISTVCRWTLQQPKTRELSSIQQIAERQQSSKISHSDLPLRSRIHTTTANQAHVESSVPDSDSFSPMSSSILQTTTQPQHTTLTSGNTAVAAPEAQAPGSDRPLVLSKTLQELLPILKAQTPHYITAHIHSFPYLLTEGDTLRLPFHMKGVTAGDVLRFNRATVIGSRDYTLKAGYSTSAHSSPPHVRGEPFINKRRTGEPSYIDERLFECRMRVMGLDSTPMMVTEKKKRRNRRTRTVTSKHKYTVLKVMEVRIKDLDEVMNTQGAQVVLE